MPCVSVIIPTYNRAHLIRATLDSVLAQSCSDYELLVVDDGSTDDTAAVLASLQERITVRHIRHEGASAARNAGLADARGTYIAYLDSDDLWHPDFLRATVAALQAAPRAGLVYCDYAMFDERGTIRPACLGADEKIRGCLLPQLLERDFLCTGALLIRRSCLEEVGGFDPVLPVAEDWDLWLRLACRYEAEYVDRPLFRYRLHPGQASRNNSLMALHNLHVLGKLRREHPHEVRPYRPLIRRHIARSHRALAGYYRRLHRPLPALAHLWQTIMVWFQ